MSTARDPKPFDATLNRMYNRRGLEGVPAHLEKTYGIEVSAVESLDVGVLRVDRRDGPPWVARVFSALRPAAAAEGDAAVLRHLEKHEYPAERLAAKEPISTIEGQAVLVSGFVPTVKRPREPDVYEILGRQLARLHTLPLPKGPAARPAGGLHHFADGSRRQELDAAASWLDQIEERVAAADLPRLDQLRIALKEAEDGSKLPTAVIHPDPVAKNIVRVDEGYAYVDWTGAGVGPRAVSLEWILGPEIVRGYSELVTLTDEEWDRLPGIRLGRHLVSLCFGAALSPHKIASMVKRISTIRREAAKAVAAARAAAS